MTLISLMVGLFISLMCVLASLTLYKNLITVAAESKVESIHDGQLAASMLTLQKEVMSAGFGIENAGAADIVRRKVDASGSDLGTIELLWRYRESTGAAVQCRGVREYGEVNADGNEFRILKVIADTSADCDAAAILTDLSWGTTVDTLAKWLVVGGLKTYVDANSTLLDFALTQQACSPFGNIDPETHWVVEVSAPGAAKLNGAPNTVDTSYLFCLPNTYPAS